MNEYYARKEGGGAGGEEGGRKPEGGQEGGEGDGKQGHGEPGRHRAPLTTDFLRVPPLADMLLGLQSMLNTRCGNE